MLNAFADEVSVNPIDHIETLASLREWEFDRRSEQELAIEAPGTWCDYGLYFAWSEELNAVHVSCAFDMRVPEKRRAPIYELVAHLNERLWIGHFALWMEEGIPMFRHTIQVPDADANTVRPCLENIVEIAVAECERFYPAFQFVIWAGKSATEAIEAAMLDTVGQA